MLLAPSQLLSLDFRSSIEVVVQMADQLCK